MSVEVNTQPMVETNSDNITSANDAEATQQQPTVGSTNVNTQPANDAVATRQQPTVDRTFISSTWDGRLFQILLLTLLALILMVLIWGTFSQRYTIVPRTSISPNQTLVTPTP
jgi:hypothetical protein